MVHDACRLFTHTRHTPGVYILKPSPVEVDVSRVPLPRLFLHTVPTHDFHVDDDGRPCRAGLPRRDWPREKLRPNHRVRSAWQNFGHHSTTPRRRLRILSRHLPRCCYTAWSTGLKYLMYPSIHIKLDIMASSTHTHAHPHPHAHTYTPAPIPHIVRSMSIASSPPRL